MYNDDYKINRALRKIMIDKGIRIDDIAHTTGKAKQGISTTLNTGINPTIAKIDEIADALGYDVQITLIDRATGERIECK